MPAPAGAAMRKLSAVIGWPTCMVWQTLSGKWAGWISTHICPFSATTSPSMIVLVMRMSFRSSKKTMSAHLPGVMLPIS